MPILHCVAEGCTSDSRNNHDNVEFFQFQKVESVRKKWLHYIRREGLEEKIKRSLERDSRSDLRHLVVCSDHFVDHKPTASNPYPTLFRYNNYNKSKCKRFTRNSTSGRSELVIEHLPVTECVKENVDIKLVKQAPLLRNSIWYPYVSGEIVISEKDGSTDFHYLTNEVDALPHSALPRDHNYVQTEGNKVDFESEYEKLSEMNRKIEIECATLRSENITLKEENTVLKEKLSQKSENLRGLIMWLVLQSNNTLKHFLGLPSLMFLLQFVEFITPYCLKISSWKGAKKSGDKKWHTQNKRKPGKGRKLSVKEEFVLILLKLKLGLDNLTLAYLFGVSVSHVSSLFSTWINFLSQILNPMIKWPSREKIRKHLPLSFKLKYPKTTAIIDCTEIFIQKPRNTGAQAATWSNYKSHNTLKALVCTQPNGAFSFISKLWSGNTSVRKITEASGFLDKLQRGDHVMADRGFQVKDFLLRKGVYLNMPPFTRAANNVKGRRLTSNEIRETRKIASLRIHVERAIRRLKSYKLLGQTLPLKMKDLSSQILKVVAAFCNFLPPLVKKYSK